ncbi:MAG: DUF433 domain-containing protein [Bacteroidetes bacterium]|nr:DUF433 domain-containing protein [Bacteroidota bacterium]MBL7105640.1 DUF433 domain-containing protein [Bacteroidales bacterium]
MQFENKPQIGDGIYTVPDLAKILNLKYYKVQRLLSEYWDNRLAGNFIRSYSWSDGKSKAVNFHTLVEFYTYFHFREAGVTTKVILNAHKELSKMFKTPFPFATAGVLEGLASVGKRIVFQFSESQIINIDMTKQLNLKFIKDFMNKLDFNKGELANRLWPLGKNHSVVVDPDHQFGQPTIYGTNIIPYTIYHMVKANEPVDFIASTYGISKKQIKDAITFCKQAA